MENKRKHEMNLCLVAFCLCPCFSYWIFAFDPLAQMVCITMITIITTTIMQYLSLVL